MQRPIVCIIAIIGILLPALVFAAPSISGVSGAVTDGQSITISGTVHLQKES
jgi:hypothetical protein